jgi:hypothetical protein
MIDWICFDSSIVPIDGKQRPRLPLLIVDDVKLFDTNAMLCYMIEEFGKQMLKPPTLNCMNLEAHTINVSSRIMMMNY